MLGDGEGRGRVVRAVVVRSPARSVDRVSQQACGSAGGWALGWVARQARSDRSVGRSVVDAAGGCVVGQCGRPGQAAVTCRAVAWSTSSAPPVAVAVEFCASCVVALSSSS